MLASPIHPLAHVLLKDFHRQRVFAEQFVVESAEVELRAKVQKKKVSLFPDQRHLIIKMQELDDNSLLREYVERDSQEAFETLIARHVNKVFSVGLRHTSNAIHAEEITQSVFIILAQKAPKMSKKVILSSWLYQTTRLTAITLIRSEIRRTRREQEAYMQNILNEAESDVWSQIAPLLDAAVAKLNETDRHAIVLRFFDGKSMKEVGAVLGASEEAAKKRVNRALERLRMFFLRRGVAVPLAGLVAAISANAVHAAPATLAKTATTVALAKGATAPSSTLALVKGSLKLLAWANAKTAVIITATILAAGTSVLLVRSQVKAGTSFPAPTWADAGYDDPVSAIKTLMWAVSRNDAKRILASLTPDCQADFEQLAAQSKPPVSVERFLLEKWVGKMRQLTELRILGSEPHGDDRVLLNISGKSEGHSGNRHWIGLKKIEGQWKFDDFDPKSNNTGRTGWPPPSPRYGGVGIKMQVDEQTREVRIKEVLPDTPASKAGLTPGLIVKEINGVSTAKKGAGECTFLTRGLVSRHVWLTLVDPVRNMTNTMELERKPFAF